MQGFVPSLAAFLAFLLSPTVAFLAASPLPSVAGYQRTSSSVCMMSTTSSRQAFIRNSIGAFPAAAVLCLGFPSVSNAAGVGEGGLPTAASDFVDTVAMEKNWAAIGESVATRGPELSADEWKSIQLFLRKVYQVADNQMKPMAKGFSEPKRSDAIKLADEIKNEAKASDKLAGKQDSEGFLAAHRSIAGKIKDYMELFNDIPDEL